MEEINKPEESLVAHAAKFGAIFGIVTSLLTFVIYAVDATMLADWKWAIFILAAILVVVCVFGIKYRNYIGGYISFGKGFQYSFIFLLLQV